jgi:hypothetical protein
VITVPISSFSAASMQFESRVTLSGGIRDVKPANDLSRMTYVPAGAN